MNSDFVSSEHVFLAILSDTDENNKVKKIFSKAGITYSFLKIKSFSQKSLVNLEKCVIM